MSDNTCAPSIGGARSIIPVLIAALLLQWLLASYQLDYRWAKWLFNQQGGQWLLKEHWLTADLIHTGGRRFSILLASVFILLYLASFWLQRLLCWRRELAYLSLAPLLSSAMVLLGKRVTGVECPWSLQPFGGELPYRTLLQQLAAPGGGACFPAGHASAGFAWFALFFVVARIRPSLRMPALCLVLLLGELFGISQQLRGAHFLSHDLWSLAVCWSVCAWLASLMLNPHPVLRLKARI